MNFDLALHPQTYYEGEWAIDGMSFDDYEKNYLVLNAKKVKGENAYLAFLQKRFYGPLSEILGSKSLVRPFYPKLVLEDDATTHERLLRFSMTTFMSQQLLGLASPREEIIDLIHSIPSDASEDFIKETIRNALRKDRAKFEDVRRKGKASQYFRDVYELYQYFIANGNLGVSFEEFIDGKISSSTKLIVGLRHYPDFFRKEINIQELMDCFDFDTLVLIIACSALDTCKETEKDTNTINNAIYYVKVYLDAVKELRKSNPKYNARIIGYDMDKQRKKVITTDDVEKAYTSLLSRHPEFTFYEFDDRKIHTILKISGVDDERIGSFDYRNKEDFEFLMSLIKKFHEDQELKAAWEIIPRGKRKDDDIHPIDGSVSTPLDESERARRMLISRAYLENSNYIYKLLGTNKFDGYVGYIYPNGKVVFEKFYENSKTKKVAKSSATYVMNIFNFIALSKLSKTEIINIIQKGTEEVTRHFHYQDMDRWIDEMNRELIGSDYTPDIIKLIDQLVQKDALSKKEVK